MSFRPAPPVFHRRRGVALVIVLAFVVLLTGLIVAFFSRALSDRQLSDGSANGNRVDVFAGGAVNTILGDFRQEIAAGSVQSNPATGVYVYAPVGGAAAPCLAGTSVSDGLANLVKRSAYDSASNRPYPFYANPAGATPYDTGAFPPSARAAKSSSLTPSLNGRTISPARWNKALLLPRKDLAPTNDTDFTPVGATPATATAPAVWSRAPDWIVVARDGGNPTAWSANLVAGSKTAAVGRFAYNVYNEGGLLDANAAGCPDVPPGKAPPLGNDIANLPGYKGSLAFADLKQLPGIGNGNDSLGRAIAGLPAGRQEEVVRTLLGWRNYASTAIDPTGPTPVAGTPVSGHVDVPPGYQWSGTGPYTNVANFLNFTRFNRTGFLRTANPLLVDGQSDRLFGGRQQLLALLLRSVANQGANAAAERASLQNAVQYLGTFSRSLSQPSFVPPPDRPKILPLGNGNYEGTVGGRSHDDEINPSFLKMRVLTSNPKGRNDGTDLVAGEPLVKTRFPLNRLAWLTYKGPSAGLGGVDIDDLKAHFGYTQAFLDQGIKETIQKYFGLTWDKRGFWVYDVHAGGTGIKTLAEVQAENREPDFVELLKAAITAGALGKTGAQISGPDDKRPLATQYTRDSSIDCQVIQVAANIIDQSDVDGYPTRIQFPSYSREFRGVENLPYFYRARNALYRIINPVPMPPNTFADADSTLVVSDPGTFIMVQQPEIWNPHAYDTTNSATMNRSLGYPRPQSLQIVVNGGVPPYLPQNSSPAAGSGSSVRPRWHGVDSGPTPAGLPLTEATTKMRFSSADASLYREPTLLNKPNIPANSGLQALGMVTAAGNDGLSAYTDSGGIKVLDSAAISYTLNGGQEPAPGYCCGIYLGKNVIADQQYITVNNNQVPMGVHIAGQAHCLAPQALTYQVQCESATGTGMDTYDEKYFINEAYTDYLPFNRGMLSVSTTDVNTYSGRLVLGLNRMMTCFDPRTSRFNVMNSITGDNTNFQDQEFAVPGLQSPGSPKWVDRANNVVSSNRLDASAGFGMGVITAGPPPSNSGWKWDDKLLRFGLFTQNSLIIPNDYTRFSGDPRTHNMGTPAAQYYADADGVVRRAMAAWVTAGTTGLPTPSASTTTGLPMTTAYYPPADARFDRRQQESRPIILNRPFRSVGDLGCVFSDTPWKNLDLATPESGFAPLLDVFCLDDTDDRGGLVAGKVDLNTRQTPVLQAVLKGAYRDEYDGAVRPLTAAEAQNLAGNLVSRTTNTAANKGPLASLADLVGGWKSDTGTSAKYDGFSADLSDPDLFTNNIPRYREGAIRALAAVGNTRVWTFMIDLVAQTGRYPQSASGLDNFIVEGEQRCWVHVAIDRYTGQVIDKQVEIVKE